MANRNRACPRGAGAPAPLMALGRQAALELLEAREEPMKRYVHTICPPPWALPPEPSGQAAVELDHVLEALARQNQLLIELLGSVNALTAAALSIQNKL